MVPDFDHEPVVLCLVFLPVLECPMIFAQFRAFLPAVALAALDLTSTMFLLSKVLTKVQKHGLI